MEKLIYLPIPEEHDTEIFESLLPYLSSEEREKIGKFHFDIDKQLGLYSNVLIRLTACQDLGITNNNILFERNKYGKPYLKNLPSFHYNISHTRNAIVLAVSDNPVGADIERIQKVKLDIAKRFFTNQEETYILNSTNQNQAFFEIWTKKEAYIKYIGKGLSISLNSFSVFDTNISKHINHFLIDNYIISVCRKSYNKKINIMHLTVDNLINIINFAF